MDALAYSSLAFPDQEYESLEKAVNLLGDENPIPRDYYPLLRILEHQKKLRETTTYSDDASVVYASNHIGDANSSGKSSHVPPHMSTKSMLMSMKFLASEKETRVAVRMQERAASIRTWLAKHPNPGGDGVADTDKVTDNALEPGVEEDEDISRMEETGEKMLEEDEEAIHVLRTRREIEYLALQLLPLQKQVRAEVERSQFAVDRKNKEYLDRVLDSSCSRVFASAHLRKLDRILPPPLPYTGPLTTRKGAFIYEKKKEMLEIRTREAFAAAIFARGKKRLDSIAQRKSRWSKVMNQIGKAVDRRERRLANAVAKKERERMNALRADDEEAYVKLLDDTKHERLRLLLDQTDEYLREIGALVQKQKDQSKKSAGHNEETKTILEEEEEEEEVAAHKASYYTQIHRISEKIVKQPSMLRGGTLKPYQLSGLNWMVSLYNNKLNGILADEMGLGKTIQTIALISYLVGVKHQVGPYLIVVPLSTLSNWLLEFKKWAPAIKVVSYRGTQPIRKKIYTNIISPRKFNVCLTTFEYVIKCKSQLGRVPWCYVVVDEGHRMKNHASKLTTTLTTNYRSQNRLVLTGTPLQNSLPELWSLLNFLLPTIFNSIENFEQWFNAPFSSTGESMEMNEEEKLLVIKRLHKVLRPFLLRRLKSDVLHQLPAKVEKVLVCKMSAMQRKMYDNLRTQGVLGGSNPNGKFNKRGLMNTMMQLRKICNHPYLFLDEISSGSDFDALDDTIWRSSGKLELLDRLLPKLKRTGHRLLIFSQMTKLMSVLEDYFRLRGYYYLRLDGTTSSDDRGKLLKLFNSLNSPYFIFILSTRAGGLGLNLQTADTVILFDSDWNPQMDLQAQDRAHRIGSKNEVRVYRLITTNSIEEKILARAQYKLALDAKVIEAGMFNTQSHASERDSLLQEILREEEDDDKDHLEVPSYKEINKMVARSEKEYKLFEQWDREREEEERERNAPPRLMGPEELPDWLKIDVKKQMEEEEKNNIGKYGRGQRERATVRYNVDEMSDDEWLEMMEEKREEDDQENDRRGIKRGRSNSVDVGGSSYLQPDESTGNERALTVDIKSQVKPPTKRRRVGGYNDEGENDSLAKCREIVEKMKLIADETGRPRMNIFHHLPDETYYRDYYAIIKEPMATSVIEYKHYARPQLFYKDVCLMFSNARIYNMEGSQVYNDSVILENEFKGLYAEAFPELV